MAFADHLQKCLPPHHLPNPTDAEIPTFLDIPRQMSLPIKPFSSQEVVEALAHTGIRKGPGLDLISG